MQIILTEAEFNSMSKTLYVQEVLHRALYDTRAAGIHEQSFNKIVNAFQQVGDKLGFTIDPDWRPRP